ncbi:MAG: lamin tail domain-containing protein [Chitinispirillales bacterium]|jgi:hypothetical protein|nr:lamin tail domain-containing protein [Chitinispirillales bacterium]
MIYRIFLIVVAFSVSASALGIVITELHRDPAAGNKTAIPGGYSHSFIELTNLGSDTFFLNNVFLTNGKTVDTIMPVNTPIPGHEDCIYGAASIPPGGTAVILSQSYPDGLAAAPATIHPIAPGTVMLYVNRRNIGGGLANDDGVALYRGTRSQIDSLIDLAADPGVFVSAPLSGKIVLSQRQSKGVSVVPVSLLLGDRQYVVSAKEPLTPGRFEPLQNGIYVEHSAAMAAAGAVRCSIAGIFVTEESDGASWRFYSRLSTNNEITEIGSGIFDRQREFLLTFDITPEERQYYFEIMPKNGGATTFPIDFSTFWAAAGTLLITEIYPKGGTAAAAGQPEWFELKNVSAAEVNLNGWMYGSSRDTAVITASDLFLPPGAFLVVTRDDAAMRRIYRSIDYMVRPARWRTLNSFNDTIAVWSPHGVEVDRAAYRSAWFTGLGWTSQSLERVLGGMSGTDSASWILCARPTPGHPGNANLWRAVSTPSLEIGPIPFSPNGDGIDDVLSIRMKIPPNTRVKVRIFGFDGKLLKTFIGEREVIHWDGQTDAGRPAPPGAIYVIAEFTEGGGKRIIRRNGVLWR